jgi:hypothetical protein
MSNDNGRAKTKGRSLGVLSAIKKSVVAVKAVLLCFAHTLTCLIARVYCNQEYRAYRDGCKLCHPVENILMVSRVDLFNDYIIFMITSQFTKLYFMRD